MTFNYTKSNQDGITIFTLEGEIIDKSQTAPLLEQIDALLASGKKRLVLDLGGLKYMNSSGLNVMVNILTKMRNAGGDAVVCNLSEKIKSLLVVTKIDTIFHILPSTDEAVKRLKSE